MSGDRKFYSTEVTIRILSEDEPWDGGTQWLSYDITEGDYVGEVTESTTVELTAEEMAEALVDAGSDADFFETLAEESGRNKQTYVVTAEGTELE